MAKGSRLCWTSEETQAVVNHAAKLIVERNIDLKWDAARVFGLTDVLVEAQDAKLPNHRRRPNLGMMVTSYKGGVHLAVERLKQARKSDIATLVEPPAPSLLGLDPKVAESLVILFERGMRALGKQIGDVVGEKIAEAVRDRHLYTPTSLIARPESVPTPAPVAPSALPEHVRRHKVLVASLKPNQQQEMMRMFPNMDFRFLPYEATSKVVHDVGMKCERVYILTRFVGHNVSSGTKRLGNVSNIPGGQSELVRMMRMHFQHAPYRGHDVETVTQ